MGLRLALALVAVLASEVGVAIAAEPAPRNKVTQLESAPPKPGPDGWYEARSTDGSFVVRVPGLFQAFTEDGKSKTGVPTHTVGVRANVGAAFGSATSYVASCISRKGDERTPKARLESVVGYWESIGVMRSQRPAGLGPIPGFEFEMADDVKVMRARIYAPKVGTCTVLLSWRPFAKPSEADIDKYLGSFQFTKR